MTEVILPLVLITLEPLMSRESSLFQLIARHNVRKNFIRPTLALFSGYGCGPDVAILDTR